MRNLVFFVIIFLVCINPAYARWASFDDASVKLSRSAEINIDEEGKAEGIFEMEAEILKESGRSIAGRYILSYDAGNSKVKVIEAKTTYQGKEYKVKSEHIEDKPLASASHGFSQKRQVLIAFLKPEIGAKIYLKYKTYNIKPELKDFYGELFSFGAGEFVERENVKLYSKIPLHILVNDPKKVLKITKDRDDDFHKLEISLTKPLYTSVMSEPSNNILNNKHLTYVSVSSLKNWSDLGNSVSIKGYTKIFKEKLPQAFKKIADKAAKKKHEIDQINIVTSLLNDKIQYIGDWRSVEGRLFPRGLAKMSKTQLGDCKDFASATAAILAKMGYKTQIVLVRRGVGNFYPDSLPNMGAFNHAMVKVVNKQGKIRWIDPTNFVSMADGVFPDVAGKKVLVLDTKKSSYEKIPNVDPKHASSILNYKINILDGDEIMEKGQLTLRNERALMVAGMGLHATKKTIEDGIFSWLSGKDLEEQNKLSIDVPNLKSRIVKDTKIKYAYKIENALLKTNLGSAWELFSFSVLKTFFDIPEYYVQDIFISSRPFSSQRNIIIKNVKVKNIKVLNKEIKSPWLYVSRKCNIKGKDLHIEYNLIIYKNIIPNEEIKTPEFLKFKKDLEKNFKDIAIIFSSRHN
ncbi:MAG: DUF3857 domain-containing protein [Rickettsiales bacterium]|nr:DUF3857 domain-containing protein [Rickettsiales bacterium]